MEHDTAFHCAIADASGNRLIAAIMRSLRDSMRRYAVEAVERLGDTSLLQADHRRILAAIDAGDPGAASRAVTDAPGARLPRRCSRPPTANRWSRATRQSAPDAGPHGLQPGPQVGRAASGEAVAARLWSW